MENLRNFYLSLDFLSHLRQNNAMTIGELQIYKNQITKNSLFSDLPEKDLEFIFLDNCVQCIACDSGSELSFHALYLVLSGYLTIEKQASDGRFVTMGISGTSSVINAASVFLSGDPISRITARTDCRLIEIRESILRKAISISGQFALNYVEFLSERIRFLNQKISSLAGYSTSSRLQMYLNDNQVDGEVTIPMSFQDFADYLGVGRASLYRTFDQLQKDGSIERSGKKIRIKNIFFKETSE